MKRATFVLAFLPLVLVTGCVTNIIQEKQEQLCKNLAIMNTSIAAVKKVSNASQATVEGLKQAEEQVTTAFNQLKGLMQDAPQAARADLNELEKAYEDLDKTIKEIPDKTTIEQVKSTVTGKVATVESAITKTQSTLRCPT